FAVPRPAPTRAPGSGLPAHAHRERAHPSVAKRHHPGGDRRSSLLVLLGTCRRPARSSDTRNHSAGSASGPELSLAASTDADGAARVVLSLAAHRDCSRERDSALRSGSPLQTTV